MFGRRVSLTLHLGQMPKDTVFVGFLRRIGVILARFRIPYSRGNAMNLPSDGVESSVAFSFGLDRVLIPVWSGFCSVGSWCIVTYVLFFFCFVDGRVTDVVSVSPVRQRTCFT